MLRIMHVLSNVQIDLGSMLERLWSMMGQDERCFQSYVFLIVIHKCWRSATAALHSSSYRSPKRHRYFANAMESLIQERMTQSLENPQRPASRGRLASLVHWRFSFRGPNGRRTDHERTPNGRRTDPKRTPNEPRTDSERTPNTYIPNGPRTNPKRSPHGPRVMPIYSETPLGAYGAFPYPNRRNIRDPSTQKRPFQSVAKGAYGTLRVVLASPVRFNPGSSAIFRFVKYGDS